MKALPWVVASVVLMLPALAQDSSAGADILKNPDFSHGHLSWEGDGKVDQGDSDNGDPFAKAAAPAPGLHIKLRSDEWSKITQDFAPDAAYNGILTIDYQIDAGTTLSNRTDDYANIPSKIGFSICSPFGTPINTISVVLVDSGKNTYNYWPIPVNTSSNDVQHFSSEMRGLVPGANKTIGIALPPGKGTITLLKVSLAKP